MLGMDCEYNVCSGMGKWIWGVFVEVEGVLQEVVGVWVVVTAG